MVTARCGTETMLTVRFLRSLPKMDDPSPILADIRRDDTACKDIGQVFDSQGQILFLFLFLPNR